LGDEIVFDQSFAKKKYLYRVVVENQTFNSSIATMVATPGKLSSAIKSEIPGIKNRLQHL